MKTDELRKRLVLEPVNWPDGSHSVSLDEAFGDLRDSNRYGRTIGFSRNFENPVLDIRELFDRIARVHTGETINLDGRDVLGYVFEYPNGEGDMFLYFSRGVLPEALKDLSRMKPAYRVIFRKDK